MTTSGTTTFDLDIEEVIEEAYERCQSSTTSGYALKSARRSLNLLFSEWGNRGVHLWKVELQTVALVNGQAAYTTPQATNDVLEAYVSSSNTTAQNTNDVSLEKKIYFNWEIHCNFVSISRSFIVISSFFLFNKVPLLTRN